MDSIRCNLSINFEKEPELYNFLADIPARARAHNVNKLLTLGLLVQQGKLPNPLASAVTIDTPAEQLPSAHLSNVDILGSNNSLGELFNEK